MVVVLATLPAGAQTVPSAAADAAVEPLPSDAAAAAEGGTAKRFVRDVVGDYRHFFSKETAEWFEVGTVAALGAHGLDESINDAVTDSTGVSLPGGAAYGSQLLHIPVAIAWWAIAAAAGSGRDADAGRDLLRAQLSVVSWTYAIKIAAQRTRPNGDPRSFPSGHASTTFATAIVLQDHYGWKLGLPAFLAASYTAASRITANQHWTSDVVFGAAVGVACGRTVTIHFRETRVAVAPLAVPAGGGVILTVMR